MELTEQQLRFLDAFGSLKFPGLFAEEMGEITNAFEQVCPSTTAAVGPLGPVSEDSIAEGARRKLYEQDR